ncbi:MAG: hypothetical protein QNJ84_10680 [Alphaproteobacteria bacterium]|nr:hypothetical protein [Alphaproteobacteria bacterium]
MLTRKQWGRTERFCRIARHLCRGWPALALLAFVASPIGPHLRIEQRYDGTCLYAGSRGVISPAVHFPCPLLAWLDTRRAIQ